MKFIIFDLEATCWEQYDKSDNETIEIGAIKINMDREIEDEFVQFVKPIRFPKLSEFCKNLTTIDQEDIDNAPHFYEAKTRFLNWINSDQYLLCSWGFYDKKQFESDCKIHSINSNWCKNHISLKHQYGKFKNLKRAVGMKRALENEGMKIEGTHHRGIDDAKNIAKIFIKYFDEWKYTYEELK